MGRPPSAPSTPAPPLPCSQVPRMGRGSRWPGEDEVASHLSPPPHHCPQSQGGFKGVVVHCSLNPPPPSSWRELRSWLPWRQGRGKRDAGRHWGQARMHTLAPWMHTYSHHTGTYPPTHGVWQEVPPPQDTTVTRALLQTHRCILKFHRGTL